jgi:hypothetical protein
MLVLQFASSDDEVAARFGCATSGCRALPRSPASPLPAFLAPFQCHIFSISDNTHPRLGLANTCKDGIMQLAEQSDVYVYTPLDTTKQQIRLISLDPANTDDEPISCHVKDYDLDSAPAYVTLSYTWGPPGPFATILINNSPFQVRLNLYNFLQTYRNDSQNKHSIWIDQICIFQAHHGERNQQVQLMSRIYTECYHVIVWLGISSQDAAILLSKLEGANNYAHASSSSSSLTWESATRAAKTIFYNNYWSRLWIVQELLLPPRVHILCGTFWLPFSKLIIAARRLSKPAQGKTKLAVPPTLYNIFSHFQLDPNYSVYENPGRGHSSSLHQCMKHFAQQECYDPRDKVYGLLSLVRKEDHIPVDYSKTMLEVFTDVMTILLKLPPHWLTQYSHTLLNNLGLGQHQKAVRAILERAVAPDGETVTGLEWKTGSSSKGPGRWRYKIGDMWYSDDDHATALRAWDSGQTSVVQKSQLKKRAITDKAYGSSKKRQLQEAALKESNDGDKPALAELFNEADLGFGFLYELEELADLNSQSE